MKSLIKRIIKEYVENKNITLEELHLPRGYFSILMMEGKVTVEYPKSLEPFLLNYISKKYNWPPTINEKWCSDIKEKIDEKNNRVIKSCNKIFSFDLSSHWLGRLYRKDEPEYKRGDKYENKKIENPEKKEGIDLFFKSVDKINEFIDGTINWSVNVEKFILLTDNENKYQEIIMIRKEKKSNYFVRFITQIKGEKFFDTPELKKSIRL